MPPMRLRLQIQITKRDCTAVPFLLINLQSVGQSSKITYSPGKRQRKQVKILCETVAVKGESTAPEQAATALEKPLAYLAEKAGRNDA